MTTKTNRSLLVQGFTSVLVGNETASGGYAQMVVGWLPFLDTCLRWSVGEGAEAKTELFRVKEYVTNPAADNKVQGYRMAAIASDILGLSDDEPVTTAIKQAVSRTLRVAVSVGYFYGNKITLATLPGVGNKRRVVLSGIPAGDMFDLMEKLPDGEAPRFNVLGRSAARKLAEARVGDGLKPLSPAKLMEAVLSRPVMASGANHAIYGKTWSMTDMLAAMYKRGIAAGLMPEEKTRGADDGKLSTEKAKAFQAKLSQVQQWVALVGKVDGEVDVAPTKEQEAVMDSIAEAWAAYRSANPLLF